jgi:hypothetical protein
MSYIIKNTDPLISTILTDAGRKKLSQGNFNITYFQVGDSEVCYDCVNNMNNSDFIILRPSYNEQNLNSSPENNKMNIKYPLFLDSTSANTYGFAFDSSFVDNIYNSAAPRGFFSGSTGASTTYLLQTSSAYTINPNFIVGNSNLISGNTLIISSNTINASVSGTVTPGMFMFITTNTSINPFSGNSPLFMYQVIGVTGNTSTATTVTIQVDRQLPNYLSYTGNSRVIFYPSGMTSLYDSITPEPYWATNVFNFETNCDVSQTDVKIWNMNIPWTESPAGVFNTTNDDFNKYKSSAYTGSKEFLGYNSNSGQTDTGSVYFYNSLGEIVRLKPEDQKSIAIVHYTNQSIDNFYGEKFAQQPYDSSNPGATGQARNLKISLPWLMWHKNPNGIIGEDFYTDPSGFTSQNLYIPYYLKSNKSTDMNDPGMRYYQLWDTHANTDGRPNRVGKVFPDLKIVVFDDDEIVAALNYKSNRTWTLPAPKVGTIIPGACNGVLGDVDGLVSANTQSVFVTYRFNHTGVTNSLHCNYYTRLDPKLITTEQKTYDLFLKFKNEFSFLNSNTLTTPSGYTANEMKVLMQVVSSATTRPDPTLWKEIDVTNQLSSTAIGGKLTMSGLTGTTIQVTKNMYTSASTYNLTNYLDLPSLNQTGLTLNFGGEYFFFGNIKTDIQATIYVMNFLCNIGQNQFLTSSNPTWDNTKSPYITEVGLYNTDKELMVISKIQSPQKRQGIQQYPVKLDF